MNYAVETVRETARPSRRGDPQPIGAGLAPWIADYARKWDALRNSPAYEARRREALAEQARATRAAREEYFAEQVQDHFHGLAEQLDWQKTPMPAATRHVLEWDGTAPGLLLIGETGTGKTRAALACLRKLCVERGMRFKAYTLKRLLTQLAEYEKHGEARGYSGPNPYRPAAELLFVDDIDKLNRQFQSEAASLWDYYNWVYSAGRAVITTTQRSLEQWENLLGRSFARRLKEAHHVVQF